MAIPKEEPLKKWVFLLPTAIYLAENLPGPKISCSLSCFPLLIGNYSVVLRSFPFYFLPIFDRESFSSFSLLPFHFFLFDLCLGIRVLAFVIRFPLRRFCCPFLRGKGWGFFSWTKVQVSLRLCLNMVFSPYVPDFDIWGKTNSCVKVSVSGWISILLPRGTRNNDDLETTCKISHGYS